jgi:hypothetical protein
MGAAREKDRADFDLERFVDMFDEALISRDPRVMDALRGLMMMVTLTRPEGRDSGIHDRNSGPLRRLCEDINHLNSRLHRVEEELRDVRRPAQPYRWEAEDKYTLAGAAQMAQQINQDVSKQQHYQAARKINGGLTLGPETVAKGLK